MKINKIDIIALCVLAICEYIFMYILSSKEVIFDFKNFIITFSVLSSYMWLMKNTQNKKSILGIFLFFTLCGFIVPVIGFFTEPFMIKRLVKDVFFFQIYPLLLITMFKIVNKENKKLYAIFSSVISWIIIIPNFIILWYYIIFHVKLSAESILAVLQSNINESIEFLSTYTNIHSLILYIFVLALIYIILYILILECFKISLDNIHIGKLKIVIFFVIFSSLFVLLPKIYFYANFNRAVSLQNDLQMFEFYKLKRIQSMNENCSDKIKSFNNNFALVIGETHNRSHMASFGYERQTTPWLSEKISSGEVILLKNSFSCAAQTQPALELALSEQNQYNGLNIHDAMNIVEMAKHAGFKVIWISNQQNDTIAGRIASEADKVYWINNTNNDTYLTQKNNLFDINIYKKLNELSVEKTKTLYIIHLLGSHARYDCRYPNDFNKWDGNSYINSYDNSVLYNDFVMSRIHDVLFNRLNVAGMVYFADHGEELNKYFCHGTDFFLSHYKNNEYVKDIIKVPIYFSFTKKYSLSNQRKLNNLYLNKDKYFTNDMIYDTMLGIMGIEECHYNNIYDLTSNSYKMNLENVKTIGGKVKIKECL